MKVVFWGTPDFAVPSLQALLGEMHEVVAVVTQPDRRAGRGRTLRASPVKLLAQEEQIPLLQPERARAPEFLEELKEYDADANVVVAYGQILPRSVLEVWPRGSFNVHASLLPALRGAAPINWAIDRGDTRTGVTI
ncbi:MAG TPA: methionyl-tRNA formyltransferase, partial [Longimicrobiales bacterium]|nr:methionyl-tRNA formyltransferase [Longimicrobiales bacterium]